MARGRRDKPKHRVSASSCDRPASSGLALFNLALDAKLRGCDLVALKVGDVAIGGAPRHRVTAGKQKTGRSVPLGRSRRHAFAQEGGAMVGPSPAGADPAHTSPHEIPPP
jgi:hypothetical protein